MNVQSEGLVNISKTVRVSLDDMKFVYSLHGITSSLIQFKHSVDRQSLDWP